MRAQHLEGIKLVSKLHQGKLKGDTLYSRKLLFYPGEFLPQPGIIADPNTAGYKTKFFLFSRVLIRFQSQEHMFA
mgnify:CR=1 FL=1